MRITAVDHYQDLYAIDQVFDAELVNQILTTPWLTLQSQPSSGQEHMLRSVVDANSIPWFDQWTNTIKTLWPTITESMGQQQFKYIDTVWWLDKENFVCDCHTDGELPGALQLFWIGHNENLGTTFYHYKNSTHVRHAFAFKPNSGYAMINIADSMGYRRLQWHSMMTPVPTGTFRLTSYSRFEPKSLC